jgi:hypothetical protein
MRMKIPDRVHSIYQADSDQSSKMPTQLFLDFDPVFPGWPPEDVATRPDHGSGLAGATTWEADVGRPVRHELLNSTRNMRFRRHTGRTR